VNIYKAIDYPSGKARITKNGHTMFLFDVVEDIKQLQAENEKLRAERDHVKQLLDKAKG
jgi:cell division protein FtsB